MPHAVYNWFTFASKLDYFYITATQGVNIRQVAFQKEGGQGHVLFDLWDTAGQEKMGPLTEGYLKEG
jgi:GTPase SAR1 family protein